MKKKHGRLLCAFCLVLMSMFCLTGCKASKKKVEESKYYKDLLTKYDDLKKENEKLQEANDSQEQESDAEKKAEERQEKFLTKIARDTLVKLEVGYSDDMDNSIDVTQTGMFEIATRIAERADRTTKYTPDELKEAYEPMYEYMLYDENNAVYEITIYGSDYVIFSDLPKYVYYVPGASVLGDAFLFFRIDYPKSTLLHRMADSPLMTDSKGRYYENSICVDTANYIDKMNKQKTGRDAAERAWKKAAGFNEYAEDVDADEYEPESKTYTYYHHGNTMKLTMYDEYICIINVDGGDIWYKVSKEDIQGIKDILRADREAREKAGQIQEDASTSSTETETDHSKEIEEESVIEE